MGIKTVQIQESERDAFLDACAPYLGELDVAWKPTPEWRASYFDELIVEPNRWLWWAVDEDGRRIGFANFCACQDWREPTAWIGEISEFTIFPDHRGGGLGRALAEAVLDELARFGVHSVEVTVRADHAEALGFWRSIGLQDRSAVLRMPLSGGGDPAVDA